MSSTATLKMLLLGEDRSASKVLKGVGGEADKSAASFSKFAKVSAMALVGASAAAVAFGKSSVDAYKSAATESGALARVTGTTIEQASQLRFAGQETGVSITALTKGMQTFSKNLGGAAGDSKKAAVMVAQLGFSFRNAHGHVRPVADLLPQLADRFKAMPDGPAKTALAMKLFGKAGVDMVKTLNRGSQGLADLAKQSNQTGNTLKDTSSYKAQLAAQRDFHAAVSGLKIQLGQALMPILTALALFMTQHVAPAFTQVSGFVSHHQGLIAALVPLLFGLAGAMTAVTVATKIWTAATKVQIAVTKIWTAVNAALDVVLMANPIGLVVIAIIALVAAIVIAYKKSETFRRIVSEAFHAVWNAAQTAFNWIKQNWPLILAILTGPIGIAVLLITKNWDKIRAGVSGVVDFMKTAVSGGIKASIALLTSLPGLILKAVIGFGKLLFNAGVAIIQGLIDGIGSMAGAVGDKITGIAKGAVDKVKGFLGINSPSRVFTEIGRNIMEGLGIGLDKGQVVVGRALDALTGYIQSKGQQISDLLSKRGNIVSSLQGFTSSVFGQDLSNPTTGAAPTAASLVAYQASQRHRAVMLRGDVARLMKMGLSRDLIQQMAASGESGIAQIHALAAGSAGQVQQLNTLNAQTQTALTGAGMSAGNALYGGAIAAAQKDKATALEIRNQLEQWRHEQDKNTIVEIHLEGRTLQMSLLQLKRTNGGKALGLT